MLITTLNIRGLCSGPKRAALKSFLDTFKPVVLFLQDTMLSAADALQFFLRLKTGWRASAVELSGLSGGLLTAWNPKDANLRTYHSCAGIFSIGTLRGFDRLLQLLNVYAPYHDRRVFWNRISDASMLLDSGLILGGDLNLTLSEAEIWGSGRTVDPLMNYFIDLFIGANLVDVVPPELVSTWSNGHVGQDSISKRLDRFLMAEYLCVSIGRFRSWSFSTSFSDHKAVSLQLDFDAEIGIFPFKFNPIWLGDMEFNDFFKCVWASCDKRFEGSPIYVLTRKLGYLRKEVCSWEKKKKAVNTARCDEIDKELQWVSLEIDSSSFKPDVIERFHMLELEKAHLLGLQEETWRQKSRAIWIKASDSNRKFFHRFANHHRIMNSVWEVTGEQGQILYKQSHLSEVAVRHFKSIYSLGPMRNLEDQL